MDDIYAYHVVTDKEIFVGQHIVFDENHHSGVYDRVQCQRNLVNMIYAQPTLYHHDQLDHHTLVALRELALEEVRQHKYPTYPSRLSCLYVSWTLEEAEKWCQLFIEWGRPTYQIVKLKIHGHYFVGDATLCFDACLNKEENLKLAEKYWTNHSNFHDQKAIPEILVDGEIEVVQIIKDVYINI